MKTRYNRLFIFGCIILKVIDPYSSFAFYKSKKYGIKPKEGFYAFS